FSLLFLFVPCLLAGQDYNVYYQGINQARLHLIEGDFPQAVASYQQVFEDFEFAFARDCYHAVETAVLAKDTIQLSYFLKRAMRQGVPWSFLLSSAVPAHYHNQPFLQVIKQQRDSLEQLYRSNINWELRQEIITMFKEDQVVRKRYYDAILLKRKKIGREWIDLNRRQVERLIEITKSDGFPGERLIGLDTKTMHSKVMDGDLSAGMPVVIFIHNYSQPNSSYDTVLFKEVTKGNIYNEHFASICDFEAAFGKGKYKNFGFYGQRHGQQLNDPKIKQKRSKIGLLTREQMAQLYQKRYLTPFWKRLY
ncbi:MAG: hypothetical protein AAF705_10485, partial [Bacteroidota bacterium]